MKLIPIVATVRRASENVWDMTLSSNPSHRRRRYNLLRELSLRRNPNNTSSSLLLSSNSNNTNNNIRSSKRHKWDPSPSVIQMFRRDICPLPAQVIPLLRPCNHQSTLVHKLILLWVLSTRQLLHHLYSHRRQRKNTLPVYTLNEMVPCIVLGHCFQFANMPQYAV